MDYSHTCSAPSLQRNGANSWGPFTSDISPAERIARLRSLRMAVLLMYRHRADLIETLFLAEGGDAEWLSRAQTELDRLPALHRRHLLASYAKLFRGEVRS